MVLLQMCPRLVYFVYALTSVSAMFIILHYSQKSPWISLSFLEILVGSESKEHICSLSVFLNLFFSTDFLVTVFVKQKYTPASLL